MPLGLTRPEGALEGRGPDPETQQASWAESVGETPMVLPLIPWSWRASPTHLSSSSSLPTPHYAPRTNVARRGPRRAEDPAQEPSRFPGPDWTGEMLGAPHPPSSGPPRVPPGVGIPPLSQPPLRGTCPAQPPLLLSPRSLPHPTGSLGGSSYLLGH